MAYPFDARALVGRTFGSVLDEITTWSGNLGFTEDGPRTVDDRLFFVGGRVSEEERQRDAAKSRKFAEIRRKFAPIVAALREGTVELVDFDGAAVPRRVWLSGRWTFYRDDKRGVEWLKAQPEAGQKVEYYNPRFAGPAAEGDKKPVRSGKRGGNTRYDDTDVVALARAELEKMTKPSKSGAAAVVVDRLIAGGHPIVGASQSAWVKRISRQL